MNPITAVFFCFGAIVGSFLNVCIVRLPKDKSIVFPSSHCVHCQKSISWFDNIPLLSWILLQGKCRHCKAPISFRYFLVELITGLVFMFFYLHFGLVSVLGPLLIMISCFIVATFVDFEHRIIPDQVSVGGMFIGIVLSLLVPALHQVTLVEASLAGFIAGFIVLICLFLMFIYPYFCKHLMEEEDKGADRGIKLLVAASLLLSTVIVLLAPQMPIKILPYFLSLSAGLSGYIIGGGIIYAMGLIGDIAFKKESMGGGDVKLMAMVGAFIGWKLAVLAFFIAPFFGAVYGIIEKIRTKDSTIAYGPFLVLASLVSLFFGEEIIRWILQGGLSL